MKAVAPLPFGVLAALCLSLPACKPPEAAAPRERSKILLTSPIVRDIVVTQQYVCQIHSQRNIEVCALQNGYLEEIPVKEGQEVKKDDVLFRILPTLYQARLNAELAEAQLAQIEFDNTKKLSEQKVVSPQEVLLQQAKLAKAQANAGLAQAELDFTVIKAPFDGVIDRLREQQGSLIKEGDVLTNLSDNSVMWVYFNVPEARYLEFKARQGKGQSASQLKLVESRLELVLADGSTFAQPVGDTVTVEGKFNNQTGNIAFRADFPNPDRLLRHGQTGTIKIHRTLHDAVIIPQRATFEILDKRYVFAVEPDGTVRQRMIAVAHELEDIYAISAGLTPSDKIVFEGLNQIADGDKLGAEAEFVRPEEVLKDQKFHAE